MPLNNVPSITPAQIPLVVHEAWKMKSPVMFWGKMGIGKSEGVRAAIDVIKDAEGLPSFDILDRRLTQYEAVDVRGIPRVVTPKLIYEELSFFVETREKRRRLLGTSSEREAADTVKTIDVMDAVKMIDGTAESVERRMRMLVDDMRDGVSFTEWSRPDILPRVDKHGEYGIVFLDELPNAPVEVQAPAYQLILDRKLGDYRLPDGWLVVAAGNCSEDRSGVYEMSAALANRFTHFHIDFNFDDWLNWAYRKKIDPRVIAYNRFNNGMNMMKFDPTTDDRAFATPRSWAETSNIIKSIKDVNLRRAFVAGRLGVPVASEFHVFCNLQESLPNTDEILENWNVPGKRYVFPDVGKTYSSTVEEYVANPSTGKMERVERSIDIDSLSFCYMVITSIASKVNEKNVGVVWDIIDHLGTNENGGIGDKPMMKELSVVMLVDCLRANQSVVVPYQGKERFKAFGARNAGTVLG